ncbi:MAG: Flp family type IVb pilin [bacterium]
MRFLTDEKGQGMTEYILLVFLIALLAYAMVKTFGDTVKNAFNSGARKVRNAAR